MRFYHLVAAFVLGAGMPVNAKLLPRIDCSEENIHVELDTSGVKFTDVYLENLKGFPMCKPEIKENSVRFAINLQDEFRCGASRMTNQMTGEKTYFQRIILENEEKDKREIILIQCSTGQDRLNRTRRQTLPNWPDIVEPDHINITEYIEARAPIPNLDLGIKQNGRMLDTTYNVQPGTPLEMVIYLDPVSKATYGILASFLKVSDSAGQQEEVVVMNGCSIDPYIFSNFITPDKGDSLSATFKAFKFPDSNYVMFSGTVSICINQCKSIPCGNGQFGHGRRRRRDAEKDPNAVYSVDMTTMLKVQFNDDLFTLQKGSVAAEFNNTSNTPALGMNHIEGVDMSSHEYPSAASSKLCTVSLLIALCSALLLLLHH
ncbi:uncharacterized protein LOC100897317 [Galendromus occidentalis]|uniref:Uncharacterized protein LOC100897317 n=1 Tax=Galendromus occidentalis TaxID=34638 RepID=A0AAJ6QXT9_9ACAR|nr:uncharacterized protein LOC100897317 [Galendromus occidentalis]